MIKHLMEKAMGIKYHIHKLIKTKCIIFLLGALLIWVLTENVLQKPKRAEWNMKGVQETIHNPEYYDVLFSGTSMAIHNISVEELYLKYGIAGTVLGEPEQMTFLSYFTVEEALKNQSPKVVFFDVKSLFYTEEKQKDMIEENENYYVHYTLDDIESLLTKYNAVKQVKELHPSTQYWAYFSKMFHNHANWEEIAKQNFTSVQTDDFILECKNSFEMWANAPTNGYISVEDNTNEKEYIPFINKKYLIKMAELCKEKGVDLVLIRGTGSKYWSWGEYNAVLELANSLDIDYLDLALFEEQIGFDWKTDSIDGVHQNISGAKKWTDFLGEYLLNKYKFADRREDKKYKDYENVAEKYESFELTMNQKIDLIRANNFAQYIDTLFNMEKDENTIFITVKNDASNCLTESNQSMLNLLGFDIDLKNKNQYSYYGVLDNGKIIVEDCSEEGGDVEGILNDNIRYTISSGGGLSSNNASITINGTEYSQNGNGFNIVVYNKKNDQILSSVFFDTSIEENPLASRKVNVEKNEKETEINYWVSE